MLDVDDGEDIIDGEELAGAPVSAPDGSVSEDDATDAVEVEEAAPATKASSKPSRTAGAKTALGATALAAKDKVKIPISISSVRNCS